MRRQLQTLAAITAFAIPLAFAGTASAWHINSSCSNSQWIVGIPNESWATGTVATFDFNQGPDATLGKGQATTAPAAATSVVVSFNNSGERLSATRPEGCVVTVQAIPTTTTTTTTVAPTTTTVDPTTTTMSSVSVVTLETPAPAALLAVDIPPVPQPQGVLSASGGQTLPSTGGGSNLLLAGGIAVAAGAVAMLVARRRVA